MKSITEIALETVEQTRKRFQEEVGRDLKDEKRQFINWYIENHKAPLNVLINDLSNYYLYISEDRITRYLSESK